MGEQTLAASSVHAVLICQLRTAPERFVWLEHADRHRAHDHIRVAPIAIASEVCKEIAPAREIEFVTGFYRFPLPRCAVWSVHLPQSGLRSPAITTELLRTARRSAEDLLGLSLYRAVGHSAGLFGFLALTPGRDPVELLTAHWGGRPPEVLTRAEWQALQVRWTGGQPDPAMNPPPNSVSRYPRAAFWARSPSAPAQLTRASAQRHRGADREIST
jgi:hypothetical protein